MTMEITTIQANIEDIRTPRSFIDPFLNSLDISLVSRNSYRTGVENYISWLETSGHTGGEHQDIIDYKRDLMDAGYSSSTISLYIGAVRQYYGYLETQKIYPNIAQGIKGAKVTREYKRDALSLDEARRIVSALPRKTPLERRNYAIMFLMLGTGLRTIEVSRAEYGDLRRLNGKNVLHVKGKGRDDKGDYVVVSDKIKEAILESISDRDGIFDHSPLFASTSNENKGKVLSTRSIRKIVKESLKLIGINSPTITAHSLRHTAISIALEDGTVPIQEVQRMARHSNINTTMIYVHMRDRTKYAPEDHIAELLG